MLQVGERECDGDAVASRNEVLTDSIPGMVELGQCARANAAGDRLAASNATGPGSPPGRGVAAGAAVLGVDDHLTHVSRGAQGRASSDLHP